MMFKEADEKFHELKYLLSDIDEGCTNQIIFHQNDRDSASSCVTGSHLNFYNDEFEAQELILEEDRLTSRSGNKTIKKGDTKRTSETSSNLGKYHNIKKAKK